VLLTVLQTLTWLDLGAAGASGSMDTRLLAEVCQGLVVTNNSTLRHLSLAGCAVRGAGVEAWAGWLGGAR
jgi:hypothetical protein